MPKRLAVSFAALAVSVALTGCDTTLARECVKSHSEVQRSMVKVGKTWTPITRTVEVCDKYAPSSADG